MPSACYTYSKESVNKNQKAFPYVTFISKRDFILKKEKKISLFYITVRFSLTESLKCHRIKEEEGREGKEENRSKYPSAHVNVQRRSCSLQPRAYMAKRERHCTVTQEATESW